MTGRVGRDATGSNIGAYTVPSSVTAVEGEVVMNGPGGATLSMTPAAARETAALLAAGADAADAQARKGGARPGVDPEVRDPALGERR